jgi:hypothetical protein
MIVAGFIGLGAAMTAGKIGTPATKPLARMGASTG